MFAESAGRAYTQREGPKDELKNQHPEENATLVLKTIFSGRDGRSESMKQPELKAANDCLTPNDLSRHFTIADTFPMWE